MLYLPRSDARIPRPATEAWPRHDLSFPAVEYGVEQEREAADMDDSNGALRTPTGLLPPTCDVFLEAFIAGGSFDEGLAGTVICASVGSVISVSTPMYIDYRPGPIFLSFLFPFSALTRESVIIGVGWFGVCVTTAGLIGVPRNFYC